MFSKTKEEEGDAKSVGHFDPTKRDAADGDEEAARKERRRQRREKRKAKKQKQALPKIPLRPF